MAEKNPVGMPLVEIVPEYQSRNPLVQWLFHKRLQTAHAYVKQVNARTVLDTGCGDGSFIKSLIEDSALSGIAVTGFDINPKIMELAPQFPTCTFEVGSVMKSDFPDGTFDAVVALDMLEHIKDVDVAIADIRRIVKTGGHFITSEPVESWLYKSLRFLIKGTFSEIEGPGSSPHFHNARDIDKIVRAGGFTRVARRMLPLPVPLDLFHINLYRKDA